MVYELTKDLQEAGKNDDDILESHGTRVELGEFVELINQYNVTADPHHGRYIVQDDVHQYEISISRVDSDGEEAYAFASTTTNEFANPALEEVDVLNYDIRENNPKDEATFDDGSDYIRAAAKRSPDRARK